MNVSERTRDDVQIVELSGRFDAHTLVDLEKWLKHHSAQPNARLIINMSGVRFIDSAGLALLVRGMKWCNQSDGKLCLCDLQPPVKIIFEMTRLDQAFNIYTDENQAVEHLAGA